MISYENVSVDSLYAKCYSKDIQAIINKYKLKTIKDLLIFMEKNRDIDFSDIRMRLDTVMKQINSNSDKEPMTYKIRDYLDEELLYNDKLNYGNILLLKSPTSVYSAKFNSIMYKTIANIIEELALATPNGENYLVKSTHKLGYSSIPIIVQSLNMYRDQIERQTKLTSNKYIDYFKMDKYEKMDIIDSMYPEIVDYIINNVKEFIWGPLTIPQKKLYESSTVNTTKMDYYIRNDLSKSISNYTTLQEVEELANGDYSVLKRFIKK